MRCFWEVMRYSWLAVSLNVLTVPHHPVTGAPTTVRHNHRRFTDKDDPLCSAEWTFSQCVPLNNKCGAGYKLGTRVGDLCRLLKDIFYCTVDCVEEGGSVHVDALFNRTKRGPHKAESQDGEYARITQSSDYRAHITGTKYVQGGCTYRVGQWQKCSVVNLNRKREDTLVMSAGKTKCLDTKTVTMDCSLKEVSGKTKCLYYIGKWSKCDAKTKERSQLKTLTSGDLGTCPAEVTVKKQCYKKNGEERCFYGQWSEWSSCIDNVKMKKRKILYGGESCSKNTTRQEYCGAKVPS